MKTDQQPLLSFAIPTYNFGKFIAETVKSIVDGAEVLTASQFEIVILDGGSKDDTDEVVHSLSEQYTNIRYIKQAERGGIDRDMNAVAEMTRGKYIWFFSADDLLEPGWDRHIIPFIDKAEDLLLVPAMLCDIKMQPLRPNPIFKDCEGDKEVCFEIASENNSLNVYLNRAATLEAFFGFMSAIIVNASLWRSLPVRTDYFGSCWAHCAHLMPLFFRKTKITYLNKFLIKKRSGNDSFMENGFVNRISISVNGWDKIIREFFEDSSHRRSLYNLLRKDMPILLFIYAKITSQCADDVKKLNSMAKMLFTVRGLSFSTNIYYLIYCFIPVSALLRTVLEACLPLLKHIRHKIKALFL